MELSEQDAFKLGFLARCAEEKLTGAALDARLEKAAAIKDWASPGLNRAASGLSDITGAYLAAATVPFGLSILGGGALGYGAAKMVEPKINDDEIKAREIADMYRLYADKAKSRRKAVKYRARQESGNSQQSFDDVYSRI